MVDFVSLSINDLGMANKTKHFPNMLANFVAVSVSLWRQLSMMSLFGMKKSRFTNQMDLLILLSILAMRTAQNAKNNGLGRNF